MHVQHLAESIDVEAIPHVAFYCNGKMIDVSFLQPYMQCYLPLLTTRAFPSQLYKWQDRCPQYCKQDSPTSSRQWHIVGSRIGEVLKLMRVICAGDKEGYPFYCISSSPAP